MGPEVVLDGLHFPHIVDLVFEHLPIEDLPSCSQICQEWRSRVKDLFSQVHFDTDKLHYNSAFNFRNDRGLPLEQMIADRRVCTLLRHCEVIHSKVSALSCDSREPPFDEQILLNVKCHRAGSHLCDGLRVLHITAPSTPIYMCNCRLRLDWSNVRRVVFTVTDLDWDMDAFYGLPEIVPGRFKSITFIYLLRKESRTVRPWTAEKHRCVFKPHWHVFQKIVRRAWRDGKTVTIVNASSLDDVDDDPFSVEPSLRDYQGKPKPHWPDWISEEGSVDEPVESESAADVLRRLAISAVTDMTPPGPVCPVQFVTLVEYRAHVGELEFAMDTEKSWIPRIG